MGDMAETRYAKADDGVHIAYQIFGQGPFDLVVIPGFISHVELAWEDDAIARALRRLASFARVIMFDKRGTGMSDRTEHLPDIDRRMLDIEAVMHAASSEQAALLAVSEGGPMAISLRRCSSRAKSSARSSTSPVCTPTRTSMPRGRTRGSHRLAHRSFSQAR